MLQVGARNMHNFALLKELGRLDQPVILKRGMSATIKELLLAAEYLLSGGNLQVILCERGIRTFETGTRATLDLSAVPVLKRLTHLPVIVDPSHAAGDRELVIPLALAAAAAGADGLIVEAHPRPGRGPVRQGPGPQSRGPHAPDVAGLRPDRGGPGPGVLGPVPTGGRPAGTRFRWFAPPHRWSCLDVRAQDVLSPPRSISSGPMLMTRSCARARYPRPTVEPHRTLGSVIYKVSESVLAGWLGLASPPGPPGMQGSASFAGAIPPVGPEVTDPWVLWSAPTSQRALRQAARGLTKPSNGGVARNPGTRATDLPPTGTRTTQQNLANEKAAEPTKGTIMAHPLGL